MPLTGKLTFWNDEKGFGFITPESGGKQVFVHIKSFSKRYRRPEVNQIVSYDLSTDRLGRSCAIKARLAGNFPSGKLGRKKSWSSIMVAYSFIVVVGISVIMAKISALVFMLYIAVSLFTFIIYAFDKSAARKGSWRTRESSLHLLSLMGGWPGALIAQKVLNHKSKKQSFRSVFWLTVLLNCVAFAWLFTPEGAAVFQSLLARLQYGY